MTSAQKIAKDKFKKAIEYRKKTGVSLKEAFAHIYGKKIVNKTNNKNKLGALPIGFKGSIYDIAFKIVNQYDIYNDVSAIMEDSETGSRIVTFDGKGSPKDKAAAIVSYVNKITKIPLKGRVDKILYNRMLKFATNMQKEVKDYNAGKKKTIKKESLNIPVPKNIITTKKGLPSVIKLINKSITKLAREHKKEIAKKNVAKKTIKKSIVKKSSSKRLPNIYYDKLYQAKSPGKRTSADGNIYYENRENRSDRGKLLGIQNIGELFDISAIKDLDSLKKQYIKLSKKYHPDAGGTTIQFQQLQNEYNILINKILNNSQLNQSQKQNEKELDTAIREVIDTLINIDGLNVELIGKWLWISGNTYPVKSILKQAGLTFIKKDGNPFWVYKGVESSSRGKTSMEEIKKKYGVYKIEIPKFKKIGVIIRINKTKLKTAINKVKKGLDKRPV